MDSGRIVRDTWKYGILYGLVVVPLGGFLGFISCFGVSMAGSGALKLLNSARASAESGEVVSRNNHEPLAFFLGFAASFVIFMGGIYLSYRLGRDKAMRRAAQTLPPGSGGSHEK